MVLSLAAMVSKSSGCVYAIKHTSVWTVDVPLTRFVMVDIVPLDPEPRVSVGSGWFNPVPANDMRIIIGDDVFIRSVVPLFQMNGGVPDTVVIDVPNGAAAVSLLMDKLPAIGLWLNCGFCNCTTYSTNNSPSCVVLSAFIAVRI